MESHHIALLTLACEAHDRPTTTRELIDKEGIVTTSVRESRTPLWPWSAIAEQRSRDW